MVVILSLNIRVDPRSIWYDSKSYKPSPEVFAERRARMGDWEAGMLPVGTFDTIQSFCRHMNNIRPPSKLFSGNYHMFKDNIRPVSRSCLPRLMPVLGGPLERSRW